MDTVYSSREGAHTTASVIRAAVEPEGVPARPRYGLRKAIQAVKDGVRIEQVASEYGEFKLLGNGRLLGHCLAADHTDRTPSFTVFTDSQRFKCFGIGCQRSGDVIDLEKLGGCHSETWTAVIALASRYGINLPERPARWHARQDEKARRRREIRDIKARLYQRRFFKLFFADNIAAIEDSEDRRRETEQVWAALQPVCWNIATREIWQ